MLRGIYTVASAMDAATRNQETVAENLSHSATPGYRRQGTAFEILAPQPPDLASATQDPGNMGNPTGYTNFEPGPMQKTDHPFDLAIVGNGFFVLDGPTGPLYTRNGAFVRNESGALQSRASDFTVRGNGGPIQIPAETTQLTVSPEGAIYANGTEVGRLELATFERQETLRRAGTTLFVGDNPQTAQPGAVRVEQGYREGSNVQPVQEMVSMMVGMRYYEAAERALRSLSDAVAQNTRPQQ